MREKEKSDLHEFLHLRKGEKRASSCVATTFPLLLLASDYWRTRWRENRLIWDKVGKCALRLGGGGGGEGKMHSDSSSISGLVISASASKSALEQAIEHRPWNAFLSFNSRVLLWNSKLFYNCKTLKLGNNPLLYLWSLEATFLNASNSCLLLHTIVTPLKKKEAVGFKSI